MANQLLSVETKAEEVKTKKTKKKKEEDEQVRVTRIQATSRMSVKIKDNFYTVEYLEERSLPKRDDLDLELEKSRLFDSVNKTIDSQIEEIVASFR